MSDQELRDLQILAEARGLKEIAMACKQELKTPLSYEEAELLDLSELLGDN